MVQHVGERARELTHAYGNVSSASIGAIQRGLLTLEEEGGEIFFGEPMLDIQDLLQTDNRGRGIIHILAAEKLYQRPKLYSTFLLWLLSELFEQLPEVGDPDKPKLVFFFDEAHLLFSDSPKSLVEKIEQVVRLIRSKGVGVYFVTQNPLDVPVSVLGQLGNRVQHALRAFTPRDQKAVKTAAETMRANPAFDAESAILELGVGEALVSFLDEKGRPGMVERTSVIAPCSRLGPITPEERKLIMRDSLVYGVYEKPLDRVSAYERLRALTEQRQQQAEEEARMKAAAKATPTAREPERERNPVNEMLFGRTGPRGGRTDGLVRSAAKSAARTMGTGLGRQLLRGILGSLMGGKKTR